MKLCDVERMIRNYKEIICELEIIEEELESLNMTGISAINYDFKSAPTNKISRVTEINVAKKVDLERRYFLLSKKKRIIEKMLSVLNNREKKLIEYNLIEDMPYRDFLGFEKLDMSESWAKKVKRDALEKMARII